MAALVPPSVIGLEETSCFSFLCHSLCSQSRRPSWPVTLSPQSRANLTPLLSPTFKAQPCFHSLPDCFTLRIVLSSLIFWTASQALSLPAFGQKRTTLLSAWFSLIGSFPGFVVRPIFEIWIYRLCGLFRLWNAHLWDLFFHISFWEYFLLFVCLSISL